MKKFAIFAILIVSATVIFLLVRSGGKDSSGMFTSNPITSFVADGSLSDWGDIKPVWESGLEDPDPGPFRGIWFKSFYAAKDEENLYFFIVTEPNLPQRFADEQSSGVLGWIYVNTDDNIETGSPSGIDFMHHDEAKGFELALWLPLGVEGGFDVATKKVSINYSVDCDIFPLEKGDKFPSLSTQSYSSLDSQPLIAYSTEGVEICVPLSNIPFPVDPNMHLVVGEELNSWKSRWNDGNITAAKFVRTPK